VLGRDETALPLLDDALDLARRLDDAERFGLAVRVLAMRRSTAGSAGDERLASLVEEAIDRLEGNEGWLRVQLRCDLALVRYRTPRRGEGIELAEEALVAARSIRDPVAITFALTGLHQAIWGPDSLDRRLGLAGEAITSARTTGIAWHESMAFSFRAADRWEAGDLAGAEADLAECARLADRGGRTRFRWISRSWQALLDMTRGDLERAESGFVDALALWGDPPNPDAWTCFAAQQLNLLLLQDQAGDVVDLMIASAAEDPDPRLWRALLTYPLVQGGRLDEAHGQLDAVLGDGLDALAFDLTWLAAMAMLSETAAALGRADAAGELARRLAPFGDRWVVVNAFGGGGLCWGAVAHQLGILSATLGDRDEARRWLARAKRSHAEAAAEPFLARTRAAAARAG
jgi:tetratricopeptide (TPR) repeat protein